MFKTVKEERVQEFALWAIPNTDNEVDSPPFTYELYGNTSTSHWRNAAVFIEVVPVTYTVPEGFDLMTKAHETLDKRAAAAKELYDDTMDAINNDRKRLYLLDAPASQQGVDLGDGMELLPPDTANEE